MNLSREQSGVALGMGFALALTIAGFALPLVWSPFPDLPPSSDQRFALWATASVPIAFIVVVAIARLARYRFFSADDIHGGASNSATANARRLQAMLQNTLEQAFLAVVAYGVWIALSDVRLGVLPALFALYFSAGRILFFRGYAGGAAARALGFALTFYPSASLIVAATLVALARLFST